MGESKSKTCKTAPGIKYNNLHLVGTYRVSHKSFADLGGISKTLENDE